MLFGAEQFEKYIGKLYLAMQSDHIAKDLQRDFERHQAGPGKKDVVTQCNTGIPVYLHIKPDNNTSTMISNALLLSLATYVWQQTHVLFFLRPRDPLATCIVGKIMVPSLSFSASREVASIANPEPLPPREGERERELEVAGDLVSQDLWPGQESGRDVIGQSIEREMKWGDKKIRRQKLGMLCSFTSFASLPSQLKMLATLDSNLQP